MRQRTSSILPKLLSKIQYNGVNRAKSKAKGFTNKEKALWLSTVLLYVQISYRSLI